MIQNKSTQSKPSWEDFHAEEAVEAGEDEVEQLDGAELSKAVEIGKFGNVAFASAAIQSGRTVGAPAPTTGRRNVPTPTRRR